MIKPEVQQALDYLMLHCSPSLTNLKADQCYDTVRHALLGVPSMADDVAAFHQRFDFPIGGEVTDDVLNDRMYLVREEAIEVTDALFNLTQPRHAGPIVWADLMAKVARECIDLTYVSIGTMVALDINVQAAWDAVHAANMTKLPNGGKIKPTKPVTWREPDMSKALRL